MVSILEKTTDWSRLSGLSMQALQRRRRLIGSSQSAVSKSVARLEHRLGVRLINGRRERSVSPRRDKPIMSESPHCYAPLRMRKMWSRQPRSQRIASSVRPQEFGRMLIATWAPEFLARHPA